MNFFKRVEDAARQSAEANKDRLQDVIEKRSKLQELATLLEKLVKSYKKSNFELGRFKMNKDDYIDELKKLEGDYEDQVSLYLDRIASQYFNEKELILRQEFGINSLEELRNDQGFIEDACNQDDAPRLDIPARDFNSENLQNSIKSVRELKNGIKKILEELGQEKLYFKGEDRENDIKALKVLVDGLKASFDQQLSNIPSGQEILDREQSARRVKQNLEIIDDLRYEPQAGERSIVARDLIQQTPLVMKTLQYGEEDVLRDSNKRVLDLTVEDVNLYLSQIIEFGDENHKYIPFLIEKELVSVDQISEHFSQSLIDQLSAYDKADYRSRPMERDKLLKILHTIRILPTGIRELVRDSLQSLLLNNQILIQTAFKEQISSLKDNVMDSNNQSFDIFLTALFLKLGQPQKFNPKALREQIKERFLLGHIVGLTYYNYLGEVRDRYDDRGIGKRMFIDKINYLRRVHPEIFETLKTIEYASANFLPVLAATGQINPEELQSIIADSNNRRN